MKTKALFLVILFFLFFSYSSKAQKYNFPDNPSEFITYVEEMLKATKRPEPIETAEKFSVAWNTLSTAQKTKVMEVSKKMIKKRATANGMYTDFYASIANAANEQKINSTQISEFLNVTEQSVEQQETREILGYLAFMKEFFLNKTLFNNPRYRVYADGALSMKFIKKEDPQVQTEFSSSDSSTVIPSITGPVIRFNTTNLTIATSFDSTGVQGTKGLFYIDKKQFVGKGGKFDWTSVELDPSQVFAELDVYVFNVSKPIFKAQNVKMTYALLLNQSVTGDIEFISRARKNPATAQYPQFISADNNISIQQFGKDLSYQGGFSIKGTQIYSQSRISNQPAIISSKGSDGRDAFRVYSRNFVIADSVVSARNAKFSLYLGESDSLSHPSLQFKYLERDHQIQLVRDKNSTARQTPFINSFHQFYIDADVIKYDLEKDSLDIFVLNGSVAGLDPDNLQDLIDNIRPVTFESFDYFDQNRYNKMIGSYNFHPLKLFTRYAQEQDTTAFGAGQVAASFGRNENVIRNVAADLESKGYLNFDQATGVITLGKRINQSDSTDSFIRAVEHVNRKYGKTPDSTLYAIHDHDNLIVKSYVVGEPNASLNRENNELFIRGIKDFPVSEQLGVYIRPDSSLKRVRVYGGRNIFMKKGEIAVGNFRFFGEDFFLLYNELNLEMPFLEKVLFAVRDTTTEEEEVNEYGGEIDFKPGRMVINDSKNKSGRKTGKIFKMGDNGEIYFEDDSYETFPKLEIPEGGTMYFYTEQRQKFAYDSTRAYFALDPIDMDSLNIKVPIFPGKFVSNIFPSFEDTLVPMPIPDLTMGFIHHPPKSGYDIYPKHEKVKDAHIKFNRTLVMTKDGLFSGGEIKHLTTVLNAPEYIFMPDSILSDNITFKIAPGMFQGAEFAEATGKTAQLRWLAITDRMEITNKLEIERLEDAKQTLAEGVFDKRYKDKLFSLYGTQNPMTMRGLLVVSQDGLRGDGNLVRKDFSMFSVSEDPFKFERTKFTARNIEFRVNSKDRDPYTFDRGLFYTTNKAILLGNFVDVDFDLGKGIAKVHPDEEFKDFASLALPYAEYKTSIQEAVWDLNKKNISMEGDSTTTFTSTIFGTEDDNKENLRFNANKAFYEIPELRLNVSGIPYINSADASIIPNKGRATILKDAEMETLDSARVLIDTLNRYHRLFNGNIKINSRLDFEGQATYQFVNVQKDTFNIEFEKFQLVEAGEEEKVLAGKRKNRKNKKNRKGITPRYTISQGIVEEDDEFYITSRVLYKGKVIMYANRRNLELDGFIKLDLSTRSDGLNEWIEYKSTKGDSVVLAINDKTKAGDKKVTSGLHFTAGTSELYTSFMSSKRGEGDKDAILAKGTLDYNPSINEFKISPDTRRSGESFQGNRLIFDDSKSTIYVEGLFNFLDENASKYIKSSGSGQISTKEGAETYNFNTFLTFDLPVSSKATQAMQEAVLLRKPEKPVILNRNSQQNPKIAEIAGDKALQEFIKNLAIKPINITSISKELEKTFILSSVDLEWSNEYKTFHSKGKLQLMSIGNKTFDTGVDGFVEIHKNPAGDEFSVYFQISGGLWYYFEYIGGQFAALSSDATFNESLSGEVEEAGLDKKEAFISKFYAVYGADALPVSEAPKKDKPKETENNEEEEEEDDGF